MARDYAAERARRAALHPGDRAAARGHRTTPEHGPRLGSILGDPQRFRPYIDRNFDKIAQEADTPRGQRALARINQRRAQAGQAPFVIGYPGPPAPGQRQGEVDTLEEAEYKVRGIPPSYARIWIHAGGFTWEKDRTEHSRARRRAA